MPILRTPPLVQNDQEHQVNEVIDEEFCPMVGWERL